MIDRIDSPHVLSRYTLSRSQKISTKLGKCRIKRGCRISVPSRERRMKSPHLVRVVQRQLRTTVTIHSTHCVCCGRCDQRCQRVPHLASRHTVSDDNKSITPECPSGLDIDRPWFAWASFYKRPPSNPMILHKPRRTLPEDTNYKHKRDTKKKRRVHRKCEFQVMEFDTQMTRSPLIWHFFEIKKERSSTATFTYPEWKIAYYGPLLRSPYP